MIYQHGVVPKCALDVILLHLEDEPSLYKYWFAEFSFKIKRKIQIFIM